MEMKKALIAFADERGLLNKDDAPAQKSMVSVSAVRGYGFELVDHSSFSPDLP